MWLKKQNRLTDQIEIDESFVANTLANDEQVIIQYSKPIYSPKLLSQLDALCVRHGEQLEIRFYGHTFNFETLHSIPNVQRLSVDCLGKIENLNALFDLAALRHLNFGIFTNAPADFLTHKTLHGLKTLILSSDKPSVDLSPLSHFRSLKQLHVTSHHKHIEAIAELPFLENLSLSSIKNPVRLGFIKNIRHLKELLIILGGRDDINEVSSESLEKLEIIRVRGFSSFNPSAFPSLHYLQIEDQIRLQPVTFAGKNNQLEELRFLNCKGLKQIDGLATLPSLKGLRISRTSANIDSLLTAKLPASLKIFAFYTGKQSLDKPIRQRLDALGYSEYSWK